MSEPAGCESFLRECSLRIERALAAVLPSAEEPPMALHSAMRAAVLGGGRRLRPALAFATARALGCAEERVLPAALAVELVHAYSLAHDDLPALDDAATRRGRPALHVEFGEALAVLAGDALLPLAFAVLASAASGPEVVLDLARAVGSAGLAGGQALDLALGKGELTEGRLLDVHSRKTGALFSFAVCGAARLCEASDGAFALLAQFAEGFGTAFQIADDLADAPVSEGGSILRVLPGAQAAALGRRRLADACAALQPLGAPAAVLRALAERVASELP